MHAGTLATFDPIDDPLDSWARAPGEPPVLDVRQTQDRFDGTPIQTGLAAARIEDSRQVVRIDDETVAVETVEERETVATEWAADPTGVGVAAAASVYEAGGSYDFPFDLLTTRVADPVERVEIDTDALADAWDSADALRGTWMRANRDDEDDFSVHYGDVPDDVDPSAGVGFEVAWDGTVVEGVVWESGYLDVYADIGAARFLDFVSDEILPFAAVPEDDDDGFDQATFGGG